MTAPLPPLLLRGDCLVELARIPDESVDAVVADPPYGLANTDPVHVVEALTRWAQGDRDFVPSGRGFMGKEWDAFVPPPAVWDECARILKPGGHLLAFAGSRTFDLTTLSIRFAGFEVRDSIAWLYGSGFPKSMDVSKAIDKAAGAEREVVSTGKPVKRMIPGADQVATGSWIKDNGRTFTPTETRAATDAAREWEGWGTALKPAFEPVVVARKPLGERTVAANVLAHGTGALNIDATRIGTDGGTSGVRGGGMYQYDGFSTLAELRAAAERGGKCPRGQDARATLARVERNAADANVVETGRWPANVALDESQAAALDEQSGTTKSRSGKRNAPKDAGTFGAYAGDERDRLGHSDTGDASRFFYVAKAPKSERPVVDGTAHPTVKPLALMRWLCRLVTPPGGVVVDPFAGSGTTLEAAYLEGFESIGVEMTPEYWPLIAARIERVTK